MADFTLSGGTFSGTIQCVIELRPDGTVVAIEDGNETPQPASNWIDPKDAAPGSYRARFVQISGDPASEGELNSYGALSEPRRFGYGEEIEGKSGVFRAEVWLGTHRITTGTYNLSVDGAALLDGDGKVPNSALHLGEAGGPAGPLDGNGKIPADELPPLQHDVGEASDQAGMLALDVTAPAMCVRTDTNPPHIYFLTADPASTLANWHDTGELGAGAADPSATIGVTATNGVANTFMRSDAAPALDTSAVALAGGNGEASTLTIGTTAQQDFEIITNNDPRITVNSIGNVGVGITNPQAPLAVAGAITVAAGTVQTVWDPTSGTELKLGTFSDHAINIVGANATRVSIAAGTGEVTLSEDLHMSEKNIVNLADPANPRDAVNKQYVDGALLAPNKVPVVHTASDSLVDSDPEIHFFDTTSGAMTCSLDGVDGKIFTIKNTGTNAPNDVTLSVSGGQIDGNANLGLGITVFVRVVLLGGNGYIIGGGVA